MTLYERVILAMIILAAVINILIMGYAMSLKDVHVCPTPPPCEVKEELSVDEIVDTLSVPLSPLATRIMNMSQEEYEAFKREKGIVD